MYPQRQQQYQLGLDPVSVASTAVGLITGIFGGSSKDPGRNDASDRWAEQALDGDRDALIALQHMTGRFGTTREGRYCDGSDGGKGGCAGWGSQASKDYANKLYQQVIARLGVQPGQAASVSAPTARTPQVSQGSLVPVALIAAGLVLAPMFLGRR